MNLQWLAAWEAVIHHPLFAFAITLGCFQLALAAYEKTHWTFLQPVLTSMLMVIGLLIILAIDYAEYLDHLRMFNHLLGPVIVALAVPLYLNLRHIRVLWQPVVITLLVAGTVATLLGLGLSWLFGASSIMQMTMLTKSVTSPIAILLADEVGGIAALAAIFSLLTGVIGGVAGPGLLKRIGVHHPAAQGIALGITAHAVGTARAIQEGDECGGFAALGMSLMGVTSAVVLPLIISLVS